MSITPDTRSPTMTRGIALTEDINVMLEDLAYYYDVSASAVIRALIEQEHLASADKIEQHKKEVRPHG